MKPVLLHSICFLVLWSVQTFAAHNTMESLYSKELSREMDILLVTPEDTIEQIIWVLHGYGGSAKDWVSFYELKVWADNYNIAFICPSALTNGWYLDSPRKPHNNVKTYLTKELPEWLKNKGLLLPRDKQWAIGSSMGGHGVLTLSLSNPELWAGVSSIAGITELEVFPEEWEIKSHLGKYSKFPKIWNQHSFNTLIASGATPKVFMLLDCGKSDFAFNVNQRTHELLSQNGIPHYFWSEPGKHTFKYVSKVMKKHIEFSVQYLKNQKIENE